MKEAASHRGKRCPVCSREYDEEDNYCGNDGSLLEEQLIRTDDSGNVRNKVAIQD